MSKLQRQFNRICFKDDASKPCKNPIKIYKYWFDFSNININIHIFSISILVSMYLKGKFQYRYQYFENADININIDMTNILVFQYIVPPQITRALDLTWNLKWKGCAWVVDVDASCFFQYSVIVRRKILIILICPDLHC